MINGKLEGGIQKVDLRLLWGDGWIGEPVQQYSTTWKMACGWTGGNGAGATGWKEKTAGLENDIDDLSFPPRQEGWETKSTHVKSARPV